MSKHASPSSSLRTLEQHNRSKSTVLSLDTDVDSTVYSSSSGTTTPEDEAQAFHLGSSTLRGALATDKPKRMTLPSREKPSATANGNARHRSLSSVVKKVKRVAHALTAFRKKRSDDSMSPILISSPLRERFGKRMAVKPHPDELDAQHFYTLPNRRFSFSDVTMPSRPHQLHYHGEVSRKYGTVSGSTSGFAKDAIRKQRSAPLMSSYARSQRCVSAATVPSPKSPTPTVPPRTEQDVTRRHRVLVDVFRILLFVPWCAAVGGALLLFPNYVELVAFGPGYHPSPKGIRRFAHWAECGQQHVMIFLAWLVAVLWYNLAVGLSLTCIVVSRLVYVWHAFKIDKSVPLGEDDQQSIFLVMMGLASADSSYCVSGPRGGKSVSLQTDDSASNGRKA